MKREVINTVKGDDTITPRTYNTIIEGMCQNCHDEFTFDPNDNSPGFLRATNGNWRVAKDSKGCAYKYAICPYCGHMHKTDIRV
jgi:hypothetical protein